MDTPVEDRPLISSQNLIIVRLHNGTIMSNNTVYA